MRKIKYLFSVIVGMLIINSCYQLDLAPTNAISSTTMWQTEIQCKKGVMAVYAGLKQDDYYGKSFLLDVNSDIAAGYGQYDVLQLGTADARTGFMNNKWTHTYDVIQRANTAIRNLNTATIDEEKKQQFLGEAKFLRALSYFHLLNYFGGVPIYDETVDLEKEYNTLMKPRSSTVELYQFIFKDLTDALSSKLPKVWPVADYGRITEGAVLALRGKVYLYNKQYAEAITDLEKVTKDYGYTLYPDFAGLFTPTSPGNTSSEMIFSISNLGGTGTSFGMPICFYAGSRSSFASSWNNTVPSTELADMYETKDGKPFNWEDLFTGYNTPRTGNLYNNAVRTQVWYNINDEKSITKPGIIQPEAAIIKTMYSNRDLRFSETLYAPYTQIEGWYSNKSKMIDYYFFRRPDLNADGTPDIVTANEAQGFQRNNQVGWETYFWRKFIPKANWGGLITDRAHTPVNFPIIRLADVYLLLAEAYNETDKQDKAVEYINKVRARVSMPLLNSVAWLNAGTKDEVFDRIFKERAYELALEGHRELDLRRWKLSEKLLNKPKYGITGKIIVNSVFNKDRDYLWPLPATELEINPNLKPNNPGW